MKANFIILILMLESYSCLVDPFSLGIGAAVLGVGYFHKYIKDNTYCRKFECCIDNHIPVNVKELEYKLKKFVFGQHIVMNQLLPALRGHYYSKSESRKPLVISFHGTPGTGKNYVSDFIAESIYEYGTKSKFVHKFMGRADFPLDSSIENYKLNVRDRIRDAIKECPRSLFIFDEIDKMPSGIFDAITSFLDHNHNLHDIDYTKSTFIFLSNSGGLEISNRLGELLKSGIQREDTKLHDFERILELGAYNLDGGLKNANIIEAHLIDHYIPFLPLEKQHVRKCILEEYRRFHIEPYTSSVDAILENFVSYDKEYGLFAKTGCKRLSKKVEVDVMSKYSSYL